MVGGVDSVEGYRPVQQDGRLLHPLQGGSSKRALGARIYAICNNTVLLLAFDCLLFNLS